MLFLFGQVPTGFSSLIKHTFLVSQIPYSFLYGNFIHYFTIFFKDDVEFLALLGKNLENWKIRCSQYYNLAFIDKKTCYCSYAEKTKNE